jgi:hypothetical protein
MAESPIAKSRCRVNLLEEGWVSARLSVSGNKYGESYVCAGIDAGSGISNDAAQPAAPHSVVLSEPQPESHKRIQVIDVDTRARAI